MSLPAFSLRHRPKTGPGSLCAECKKPFTIQEWDQRHTTGAHGQQRFTHGEPYTCCWCQR